MTYRIRSLALSVLAIAVLSTSLAAPAQAENWIFSQGLVPPPPAVPIAPPIPSRRPMGGPFYTRPEGAYFSGGLRNARFTINVRGRTVDQTILWESWFQTGRQF